MSFALIKKFLPKTLFWRFSLIFFLPIVLLQGISVYIFYERHWDTLSERLADTLANEVVLIYKTTISPMDEVQFTNLKENFRASLGIHTTFLPNARIAERQNPKKLDQAEELLFKALASRLPQKFTVFPTNKYRQVQISIERDDGLLILNVSRKRLFSSTTYIFVIWTLSLATLFTIITIMFVRNQLRPIRRLAVAAENFGKGKDIDAFTPQGAMEIRQAAKAFNIMRERILRQISQRTEMLAGVSHDLRTPLTRLKLQLALLPESEAIKDMQSDIDEMSAMIDGYLSFAKGEGPEKTVRTDVAYLVRDILKNYQKNTYKINFKFKQIPKLKLRQKSFKRCLQNILDNSIKYADIIEVSLKSRQGIVYIIIDDNGPGIDAKNYEEVFKPFNRLDESRNLDKSGVGLGLTVARDIVRGHGGDITLETSKIGGLRVIISLPV